MFDWKNTELKRKIIKEEILALKQQRGKSIFAGSPSLIVALTQLGLIDEYQFAVQPTILEVAYPYLRTSGIGWTLGF